jgi:hypothetical protein
MAVQLVPTAASTPFANPVIIVNPNPPPAQNAEDDDDDDDDKEEISTEAPTQVTVAESTGWKITKACISLGVIIWCAVPPVWTLFASAINRSSSQTSASRDFGSAMPTNLSLTLAGYGLLCTMFSYAIWCAAGFICAWGIERALASFGGVFSQLRTTTLRFLKR